jgi:cysteine-S-conjugate beta-lyase
MSTRKTSDDVSAFGNDTRLVMGGRDPFAVHGFVNLPVFHGSTVLAPTMRDLMGHTGRYSYARRGTPQTDGLEETMRMIDGSAGVVPCPSGLSAVTTALLACLSAGDHLLMTDSCYGPTRHACDTVLRRLGIETTYYDPVVGAGIADLMRPNTRAVYVESPGSLTFEVQDLPAIAAVAHAKDALVVVDNTWATPLFLDAIGLGADLVVQAGTKYLVGHSDAMFGVVSAAPAALDRLKGVHGDLGLCVGPDDLFLAMRGMRTLAVRLRHHERSALTVAQWLAGRPEVLRVLHPALQEDPGHAIWKRDFRGSSGLFAFVLKPGSRDQVAAFLDNLALFGLGYSWGGYESLAIPFDARSGRTATRFDPGGPAIRLHIGLEDVDDLIRDLGEGLHRYAKAGA